MSREHAGALIVFEREVGLNDFIDTGIIVRRRTQSGID